jgi:hypothetical protein
VNAIEVTPETCFKEFVEETKGIRFIDLHWRTDLYRDLVEEFNGLKQVFIDLEEREERRRIQEMLSAKSRRRFRLCVI